MQSKLTYRVWQTPFTCLGIEQRINIRWFVYNTHFIQVLVHNCPYSISFESLCVFRKKWPNTEVKVALTRFILKDAEVYICSSILPGPDVCSKVCFQDSFKVASVWCSLTDCLSKACTFLAWMIPQSLDSEWNSQLSQDWASIPVFLGSSKMSLPSAARTPSKEHKAFIPVTGGVGGCCQLLVSLLVAVVREETKEKKLDSEISFSPSFS